MSFYKNFTSHRGCDQWPVVPDQGRLIKPDLGSGSKKVKGAELALTWPTVLFLSLLVDFSSFLSNFLNWTQNLAEGSRWRKMKEERS